MHAALGFALMMFAASEWTPPANPDVQQILNSARADTRAGRYEDALAKHVWFHENALKHEPAMYGVRLSFALSYWHELAGQYPPALEKMKSLRDAAREQVFQGKNAPSNFHDLSALNEKLGDAEQTATAFQELDRSHPAIAKQVYTSAEDALIQAKEYALCGKYLEPAANWRRIEQQYQANQKMADDPRFGADFKNFTAKSFRHETATLIALLVVNNRKPEAESIAEKARKLSADQELDAALKDALAGKVPPPWP